MKKAIPVVVGLVVVAGVAGGVTYAVVNKKKKQCSIRMFQLHYTHSVGFGVHVFS